MTSTPAPEPPFALDGAVNALKLDEVLAVGTELTWLDFKRECDLSDNAARVEFAKDAGAMMFYGGYLVVGVEDDGVVVGMPKEQARLFDEATVRDKLDKYLGDGYEVRSQVHKVTTDAGEVDVALVWMGPHPDGFNVFKVLGNIVNADGKQESAFRKGDVFARHGSRSERWNQADLVAANARRDALAKEQWRAEYADEFARMLHAARTADGVVRDPSVSFTWRLDADGFEASTVELMRRDDDVPLRRMLRDARAEVERIASAPVGGVRDISSPAALGAGPAALADLVTVLDRVTTVAALALDLDRPRYFTMATRTLADMYSWSITDLRVQTSAHGLAPVLRLRLAERLYALGGLAVRLKLWAQVRSLILLDVAGLDEFNVGRTWHRDALTGAANAKLFNIVRPDGRVVEVSLPHLAAGVAAAMPVLRPDVPDLDPRSPRNPVLSSVCAFDLLAAVIASTAVDATSERSVFNVSYPNFARFDDQFDKVVAQLVTNPQVRSELVADVSDATLARVLVLVDNAARQESARFFGWEGYRDQSVKDFIAKHAP